MPQNQFSSLKDIHKAANIEKHVFTRILDRTKVLDSGVILSQIPEDGIEEYECIFEDQIVGTEMGPLFCSYPNIPLKAVYESLARDPILSPRIPEYFYSCPTIDDMLLGHHPKTYYFDISRAGPVSLMRRSMGYVKLAIDRHIKSENKRMKAWIQEFGIGTCVPVVTFDTLVGYTTNNNARMYAVPATSVAESLMACATYFTGMRGDIARITRRDSWMEGKSQARNKGSLRIYEALHKYIIETRGLGHFKSLITHGGSLTEIASLYMEMAEKQFLLGVTREQISNTFAEIVFDPRSPRSHPNYGAQADCSELVVRGTHVLDPIPWEVIFLLGDNCGTTLDQIIRMAEQIKRTLPNTVVIVAVDHMNSPLLPQFTESSVPTTPDYFVTAWSDYILGDKIHRQKGQLIQQQSARR
jgi:hypothetical protein